MFINSTLKWFFNITNLKNVSARERYGILTSIVGIFVNLLLSILKLIIGILSGAISIIADAINNISDMAASIIMLIGFRFAAQPADKEHPFGHGRAEYLSRLFIALAMIFAGVELFYNSIKKIIEPEKMAIDHITLIILFISIATKFSLAMFYRYAGKRINSNTIYTAAFDSFMDCLSTTVVLISAFIYIKWNINIDGAAGLFISLFIIYGGCDTLKNSLQSLIGDAPTPELIEDIQKLVTDSPEIIGIHDLIIHDYGANRNFVSMHVEMPASMELLAAHEIIDRLERRLQSRFHISATLHIDPVITDDVNINNLLLKVMEILNEIDDKLSLHDFRVVPYKTGRKLIFDVTVPEHFHLTDREIDHQFQKSLMRLYPKDRAIIHMDHQYC